MATMKFKHVTREIPPWARWLAQDANGEWHVFNVKPRMIGDGKFDRYRWYTEWYQPISHVTKESPPADWTQELYRLVWA